MRALARMAHRLPAFVAEMERVRAEPEGCLLCVTVAAGWGRTARWLDKRTGVSAALTCLLATVALTLAIALNFVEVGLAVAALVEGARGPAEQCATTTRWLVVFGAVLLPKTVVQCCFGEPCTESEDGPACWSQRTARFGRRVTTVWGLAVVGIECWGVYLIATQRADLEADPCTAQFNALWGICLTAFSCSMLGVAMMLGLLLVYAVLVLCGRGGKKGESATSGQEGMGHPPTATRSSAAKGDLEAGKNALARDAPEASARFVKVDVT